MRSTIYRNTVKGLAALAAGLLLASCSEWTQTESLGIDNPTYGEKDPQAWAQYMDDLRDYKNSDHPVLYAVLDNPAMPFSAAYRLAMMPDSIDIIALGNPGELQQWMIDDIKAVQQKATKVLCTLSFTHIEALYELQPAPQTDGEGDAPDGFLDFAAGWLDTQLGLCARYGYDGVVANFMGKAADHMDEVQKELYQARVELFTSRIGDWLEANTGKMFVFEGIPQNLPDRTLLTRADYIVLRSIEQPANMAEYGTQVLLAMGAEGVPTDRFIITVDPYSTDNTDVETGFITVAGSQVRAMPPAAWWVITPNASFGKAGLAVNNVQDDYYLVVKKEGEKKKSAYQFTREAIAIMNPAPKN